MDNQPTTFRDEVSQNEPNNEWRGLVATALIGIILGFVIGYFVFIKNIFNPNETPVDTATSTTETTGATTSTKPTTKAISGVPIAGAMSIDTVDQVPGLRTQIKKMSIAEGAWVVTFSATEDESRPNLILGAQYFEAGTYTDITSYLAEGLVAGQKYFVALYQDDTKTGTHTFDSVKDKPFIAPSGYWVMDSFEATSVGSRG